MSQPARDNRLVQNSLLPKYTPGLDRDGIRVIVPGRGVAKTAANIERTPSKTAMKTIRLRAFKPAQPTDSLIWNSPEVECSYRNQANHGLQLNDWLQITP